MDTVILVVVSKNDQASQKRVEEVLRRSKYEVFRKKTVEKALQELRELRELREKMAKVNLVITNFQILELVGHEIMHNIQQTLNLSVLTMASDERIKLNDELLMYYLYIVEDFSKNDLNILLGNSQGSSNIPKSVAETSGASSSSITNKRKKPESFWTTERNERNKLFEDAIDFLHTQGAVSVKALRLMITDNFSRQVTREQVSRHFQRSLMSKQCSELTTAVASLTT